jgi:tubulin polyglutamylase TTLL6/13|tara:strand:- start:76 stop:405 length:330 start_codon:yes stop_codon:yes gene_type:complete
VLITCINPLRIYIYREGLARFATNEYVSPVGSNLGNLMMHLTNYAINKESDDFVANENAAQDDVGHKRSLTAIFKIIDEQRLTNNELLTSKQCWQLIKELTVKTIIAGH